MPRSTLPGRIILAVRRRRGKSSKVCGGREDADGAAWPPQTLPWGHMSRQNSPTFVTLRSHSFSLASSCHRTVAILPSRALSRPRALVLALSRSLLSSVSCPTPFCLTAPPSPPPPRAKLGPVEGALAFHPTSCYCDHAATPPPHSMLHPSPPLSPPEFAPTPFTPHDCTTFTWLGWLSPI